ncbi:MAG: hypothetical protein ABR512_08760 [Desulfopila sp.]
MEQPQPETGSSTGRIGNRPYWVLQLSIVIRALHQIGAAVFLASFLLDGRDSPPTLYLLLAVISGVALVVTEWLRHRQMYRELSGMATIAKLILLGLAVHNILPAAAMVTIAFVLASICAHAPKHIRHRLLV